MSTSVETRASPGRRRQQVLRHLNAQLLASSRAGLGVKGSKVNLQQKGNNYGDHELQLLKFYPFV